MFNSLKSKKKNVLNFNQLMTKSWWCFGKKHKLLPSPYDAFKAPRLEFKCLDSLALCFPLNRRRGSEVKHSYLWAGVSFVTSSGNVVKVLPTGAQPGVHVGHLPLHQLRNTSDQIVLTLRTNHNIEFSNLKVSFDSLTWKCPIFCPKASLTCR